jgi:hypothetical protein
MTEDSRLISISHSDRNGRRGLRVVAGSYHEDAKAPLRVAQSGRPIGTGTTGIDSGCNRSHRPAAGMIAWHLPVGYHDEHITNRRLAGIWMSATATDEDTAREEFQDYLSGEAEIDPDDVYHIEIYEDDGFE